MTTDSSIAEPRDAIRVLIVEDHEHVLWGLRKLIEGESPRMRVVGAARGLSAALEALRQAPDVVVLDLFLDRDNVIDHLACFCATGAAIVVLTGGRDGDLHQRALNAGAWGLVRKDAPAEVLLREIERAHTWRREGRRTGTRQQDCQWAVGTGPRRV